MLSKSRHRFLEITAVKNPPPPNSKLVHSKPISTLKVPWRKDRELDQAIESDKRYKVYARVVREVLNEPGQTIPLRYLENRRERLGLRIHAQTFLSFQPNLFELYMDRIKPKTQPVKFIRPTETLRRLVEDEARIYAENEELIVTKIRKLLMMSNQRVLSAEKLFNLKRDFGFPVDFLTRLVPKYPEHFRLAGSGRKKFVELVSWDPSIAKSVIEVRAEEESRLVGVRVRPNFSYKLPRGHRLRKPMLEWVRDWLELRYISPYSDSSEIKPGSMEMEKRRVAVLHELLSLSLHKRVAVASLGKFTDDMGFSNTFSTAFTRHPGIFYMSLKGAVRTAVLREAYEGSRLVDRDPLLEIKDRFVALMKEGFRMRCERLRVEKAERIRTRPPPKSKDWVSSDDDESESELELQ